MTAAVFICDNRDAVVANVFTSILLATCLSAGHQNDKKKATPNFSGTWVLNKSRSSLGRFGQGPFANAELTLVILHDEPELKITRKTTLNGTERGQEMVYYSDGRGETNAAAFGNNEVKTKTKWEGTKLVSKSSISRSFRRETFFTDTSERRELSEDGRSLTITVSISGPAGTSVIKQVFDRRT